jgi:hypothetical protein
VDRKKLSEPVMGSYEQGTDLPGSINGREFIYYVGE